MALCALEEEPLRLKGGLGNFIVFFTPVQVLIDGIFEVLLGQYSLYMRT